VYSQTTNIHVISQQSHTPNSSILQKRKVPEPATGQYGENYEAYSYKSPEPTQRANSQWFNASRSGLYKTHGNVLGDDLVNTSGHSEWEALPGNLGDTFEKSATTTRPRNDSVLLLTDIENTTPLDISTNRVVLPSWKDSRVGKLFDASGSGFGIGRSRRSDFDVNGVSDVHMKSAMNGIRNLGNTCFISATCQVIVIIITPLLLTEQL
jgi:hypothetical protein